MKSGLEGRNNPCIQIKNNSRFASLNEVRPRRPEQYTNSARNTLRGPNVSMKSGLEGRNKYVGMVNEETWYASQ